VHLGFSGQKLARGDALRAYTVQYTVERVRECGICHRILAMLALIDAVSTMGECEAPPVWRMKPAPTAQSGDSAHGRAMKGLRRNKKRDVVTFDMESTLCGRVRIWEDGRAKRYDGRTWLAQQAKIGLLVWCCAGWSARGL
jgi:hypothetical protein